MKIDRQNLKRKKQIIYKHDEWWSVGSPHVVAWTGNTEEKSRAEDKAEHMREALQIYTELGSEYRFTVEQPEQSPNVLCVRLHALHSVSVDRAARALKLSCRAAEVADWYAWRLGGCTERIPTDKDKDTLQRKWGKKN